MIFTTALWFLAGLGTALPSSALHKRVAVDDVCNLGFATQNGGYEYLTY